MVVFTAFFPYAYYDHPASFLYAIMSGRIFKVSMTLPLDNKHSFTNYLWILGLRKSLEKSSVSQNSLALYKCPNVLFWQPGATFMVYNLDLSSAA